MKTDPFLAIMRNVTVNNFGMGTHVNGTIARVDYEVDRGGKTSTEIYRT